MLYELLSVPHLYFVSIDTAKLAIRNMTECWAWFVGVAKKFEEICNFFGHQPLTQIERHNGPVPVSGPAKCWRILFRSMKVDKSCF